MPVLILGILAVDTRPGYVFSAKDVPIVRLSLAHEKLRKNKYLDRVHLPISYSVSIITFR